MRTFKKYKQNLSLINVNGVDCIKSYSTIVAIINYEKKQLIQLGWWSVTTQKHINYAAYQLGLTLTQNK